MIPFIRSMEPEYEDTSTLDGPRYKLTEWRVNYTVLFRDKTTLDGQLILSKMSEKIPLDITQINSMIVKDVQNKIADG